MRHSLIHLPFDKITLLRRTEKYVNFNDKNVNFDEKDGK